MGLFDSIRNIATKNNSFSHLKHLIQNTLNNEVVLDSNFVLTNDDSIKNIEIDEDNLTIDGNGHYIDAKNNPCHFIVSAKNIIIKNLTFKNIWNHSAVAVEKDASCTFINCNFFNNHDEAIYNMGNIKIENCSFKNNSQSDKYSDWDITNRGNIILNNNRFESKDETVRNSGKIIILDEDSSSVNKKINNMIGRDSGYSANVSKDSNMNLDIFTNITDTNIELKNDIDLTINELNDFDLTEGIEIKSNDLIINANNHSIDANFIFKFFKITAKNIIFKNMIFNRGSSDSISLLDTSSCEFLNCTFNNSSININDDSACKFINCNFNAGNVKIHDTGNCIVEECVFNESGITIENNGSCKISDSKFEKKNASAIVNKGNLEIDSSLFSENSARCGGAIDNYGKSKIDNCQFIKNRAFPNTSLFKNGNEKFDNGAGGAISNSGEIKISNSKFIKNYVTGKNDAGSAIANLQGHVQLFNCEFSHPGDIEDDSADDSIIARPNISRQNGTIKIIPSNPYKLRKSRNIIENHDYMDINHCIFENIDCEVIISNLDLANLNIEHAKFKNNSLIRSVIDNDAENCNISKTLFEKNTCENYCIIKNTSKLSVNEIDIKSENSMIVNSGQIFYKKLSKNFEEHIDNTGEIINLEEMNDAHDFYYLNNLIQNNDTGEVRISEDITFKDYESDFFEGGIELNQDNLTVDGKGNVIDANGLSRIFIITGKNITLRNIIFKNGNSSLNRFDVSKGGSIMITENSTLKIENCKFINSSCERNGGTLLNRGELEIINSTFEKSSIFLKVKFDIKNSSKLFKGGVIYNFGGKLKITDCEINESYIGRKNTPDNSNKRDIEKIDGECFGGAIYNESGIIEIKDSKICDGFINAEYGYGGAVYNKGQVIEIENCELNGNVSFTRGGAIHNNDGILKINECLFKDNDVRNSKEIYDTGGCGGSISNEKGDMIIEKSAFKFNVASEGGGAIINSGRIRISDSDFDENITNWVAGGSISNSGDMTLINARFIKNTGRYADGGAINNTGKLNVADCCFYYNTVNENERYNKGGKGGAINNSGELVLENSIFKYNRAKTYHLAFDGYFGIGGAICNDGKIIADNLLFENNTADNKCGAIFTSDENLEIKNSAFKNNQPDNGDY